MSAHPEIDRVLIDKFKLTVDGSTPGVSRLALANNILPPAMLDEVVKVAQAEGYEVHMVAGDLRIRPKDSNL